MKKHIVFINNVKFILNFPIKKMLKQSYHKAGLKAKVINYYYTIKNDKNILKFV